MMFLTVYSRSASADLLMELHLDSSSVESLSPYSMPLPTGIKQTTRIKTKSGDTWFCVASPSDVRQIMRNNP